MSNDDSQGKPKEEAPSSKTNDNDQEPKRDPFDPANLRISQDFAADVGLKKALLTVPVRKANRHEFIRVHPDEAYRLQTAVIEFKEDRAETYLVAPELRGDLVGEVIPKVLFTAINRQGVLFLWPVRLPGEDGRLDAWNQSALEAAQMAMNSWVRVAAKMSLGAYEVHQATGQLAEPTWPDVPFREILRVAFKGRFIESLDHPVLRRLRGEV